MWNLPILIVLLQDENGFNHEDAKTHEITKRESKLLSSQFFFSRFRGKKTRARSLVLSPWLPDVRQGRWTTD